MSYQREYLPLTHPQQGIWYTSMMFPGTSIANVAGSARVKGIVDYVLLDKAINLVIKKNDAYRIRLTYKDGQVLQYISEYHYKKIDYIDFSKYDNPNNELFKWDQEQSIKPIELYDTDLFYYAIMKLSDQETVFYTRIHHIISDAWTMSLMVNQILEFYSALKRKEDVSQISFPSYTEYIMSEGEYKKSEKFIKDQEYWLSRFNPLPEMTVLKMSSNNEKHTSSKRKTILTPLKFTLKLREYCKKHGTSPYPLFIAALSMYINRVTAKKDIIIGTPVLNRANKKEKDTAGMFINTLPVRINVDPDSDFLLFSENVQMECMSLLRHQKYPYDLLLKDIRAKYNISDNLYDIVLSYQNSKMGKKVTEDQYMTRWHFNHHQVNSLTIHINDRDDDGRLIIDYDYHDNLYHAKEIDFLHNHMLSLLWHAIDNPEKNINKIEMLPESEKYKVLYEFNNTDGNNHKDKAIFQIFEEQVEKTPENIALVFEEDSITYRELNNKANRLATVIREYGGKRDDVIALMMNRSLDIIIGILGILKAGCAFLPIDPEYPDDRVRVMLEDSRVSLLLTQTCLIGKINTDIRTIDINSFENNEGFVSNLPNVNEPDDLAYVIYTSGSTGLPKGVMISHKNVVNFTNSVCNIMNFMAGSTVLSISTISFDIFIFEIIPSLATGMKIIIANKEQQIIPLYTHNLICKHKIEVLHGTPSRIQSLIDDSDRVESFKNLKIIIIGGETFHSHLLEKLKKVTNARIFNGYGPTETTVGVTFKELTDTMKINIGTPIENTRIYILDRNLNPVPIGIPGDLYIGGDSVGRGYINRPEESKSRFLANPFVPNDIIYNSGDLARWYPKGEIDFLGRIDHQVKIKGLRIELGEIENQLIGIDGINKAVVVVREDENDNKALCAYYVSSKEIQPSEFRKTLSKQLPNYMVPAFYIRVDFLPYMPNGKVDINSLPQINTEKIATENYTAPRNELEKKLVKAWKDVLNLKKVGIDNNFFDLGGDSLAVIMLQVKLFEYKLNLKTQDFYKYATIRELSEWMSNMEPSDELGEISFNVSSNIVVNEKVDIAKFKKAEYRKILLIGSTGFLGIHILDYLLSNTDCLVSCIVRGSDADNARERLEESLSFYFPNKHRDIIENRLFVYKGDISCEKIGLTNDDYYQLGINTDAVIHSAALVKYYGNYEEFKRINVIGTENVIDFALKSNVPMYYISTLGLSGQHFRTLANKKIIFSENDLYDEKVYLQNMYIRSKYEAERLIRRYKKEGLKVALFRVGNLTGRFSDGHFQKNINDNSFYNINKSILNLGAVSNNILGVEFDLTPVDLCSKAIVQLLFNEEAIGKTFHIYNHNTLSISNLLGLFQEIGVSIESLDSETFKELVNEISHGGPRRKNLEGIINDFNSETQLDFGTNIKIRSDLTTAHLEKIGFYWPDIDANYLRKLYNYMKEVEFLGLKYR